LSGAPTAIFLFLNFRALKSMKVRDIIKQVEKDGWVLDRTRGDHRQYVHREKRGLVTIPGHPSDDVPAGTLKSILTQAGLKK
jgi:predicted RNA binding protein YcfA (HicA-like mRNA interferase family)